MFTKSILNKGQQRWFWFIAVTSVFLTSNGFYLWAFDSVDFYYMANVLAHLAVGFLFAIPFIAYIGWHYWTARRSLNSKSKWMGWILFGVIIVALGTGVYMTFAGVRQSQQWVLIVHIAVSFFGIAFFTLHRLTSTHKVHLGLSTLREAGIILAGFLILTGAYELYRTAQPKAAVADEKKATFAPSPFTTTTGRYLNGDVLSDNESCKDCHPDAYKQWESSLHAKAAFNLDPYHRRTFEYMMRTSPPALVRFCAACHDPVILASGELDTIPSQFTFSSYKYANTSISCNACHAIQSVDVRGNGQFTLGEPAEYPFAHSTSSFGQFLNYLLIKVKPEAHRNSLTKPFFSTAKFCVACHKLAVPEAVNHYKWMRGQDQYDQWDYSGVSAKNAVSWYTMPNPVNACQGCHMKRVASDEFGSVGGTVPNHWMPAASSELAILSGDTAWLHRVVAFMKDNRVSIDVFGAICNANASLPSGAPQNTTNTGEGEFGEGEVYPPVPAETTNPMAGTLIAPLNGKGVQLAAGKSCVIETVLRTRMIGHTFTQGTMDINDSWVRLVAYNANGKEFFMSGDINPSTDCVDTNAHFIRLRLFTEHDTLIQRHNINQWTGILYNHVIPPGNAQTAHYRLDIPPDAGDHITIIAQIHYRKFNKFYTDFSLQGIDTSRLIAHLPYDIVVAADTVTIPVGADYHEADDNNGQSKTLSLRYNDYAIGLFNEGNDVNAAMAFRQAAHFDTSYADAYINLARIAQVEGDLPAMKSDLDLAGAVNPDYYKLHYFRGQYDKMTGQYENAIHELKLVYSSHPEDRNTITTLARLYYLQGDYKTGLDWCRKELAIDPEDYTANYNASLCFRVMGVTDSADYYANLYKVFEPDIRVFQYAQPYRLVHPSEDNEADAIHIHGNDLAIPANMIQRQAHKFAVNVH